MVRLPLVRLSLVLLVLAFVTNVAAAQAPTLSGTVVDQSGAAVPGATVELTGSSGSLTVTTNDRGAYSFTGLKPDTYRLTIQLEGFAPATRPELVVGNSDVTVPPVRLTLASLTDTVVVTATKAEAALVDAPATMSVISSQTLASTPAQNYGDLLRPVPGLNVIQLSARDINLTSRQSTATLTNSQLVLLDGRSVYLDFFGIVLWDFLPTNLNDIKQIEVVRGPASAVWGANALTGVVNIITKSPREAPGADVTLSGGWFSRDAGSGVGTGAGNTFRTDASYAAAPNDHWSYRLSAGYFNSDPLPRPVGTIPLITDPRDPTTTVGGGVYPADSTGRIGTAFQNQGTSQPKFDARVDQEIAGGRITYGAGVAGSSGIIHTGIGPFDIQNGSYIGYGKVNYSKGALKLNAFTNLVNAQAPNLLFADPTTGQPLQLNFKTQTYDFEAGDSLPIGHHQVITLGGNVRRNNFDITIAPNSENRTELGAYGQDEIITDWARFTIGGRVDKFGNLSDPVFSPRLAAVFKPRNGHSLRVSFNRAFRSPSVVNNYLDVKIVSPTDLSRLASLLPPPLRPAVAQPFPLVVNAVGSKVPINNVPQPELTEESLTAYEVAYTGTFGRTTAGAAFYVNDLDNNINFVQLPNNLDPYTAQNPPPGWPLPASIISVLAQQGIFLPRTAFTYLNLGPLRQKGIELSLDHRVNRALTAFANYSWQAKPAVLSDPNPFPATELALPPTNRFNIGGNYDDSRFLGSFSVNYSDKAFWSDVLSSPYHGYTDAYTLVNASFGVKWNQGRITTTVKANNLLNQTIQQHVFGDLIKGSVVLEARFHLTAR